MCCPFRPQHLSLSEKLLFGYLTKLHFESCRSRSPGSRLHFFSEAVLSSACTKRWPLSCLILPRPFHQPTFLPPQSHLCSLTKWHTQTAPPSHTPHLLRSLSLLLCRRLYGRQAWQFCQNHSECVYLRGKWQDMCFWVKDVENGVCVCVRGGSTVLCEVTLILPLIEETELKSVLL